ncbi:NAD(P)/FAD-dependent oxidoreductase [Mycobacterium sp. ITM-2016-00316]|uniref:NAD(P)/FAD-dependent oxidoreductase n=1 Tax=Mycobacterium sp. ITM-2016-00316 TaxID=2099695 RepID=UPI00287FB51E|nr:NAD(P)/FAD-dependent oxidoreductase [Mycobacterium sp. ITM-2016-00316]WNG80105.1 NAD(P)/FAD-dependent oxidoreductase [Mycobacterium sp. ITM-2016-00316]
MNNQWDCIIVGGGAAGLSAALVLGRARRRTLILDDGEQSNLAAHGIGGLLGHDGRPPAQLYEAGRAELTEYPNVTFRSARVTAAKADGPDFVVELADGGHEHARRILLATGMQYRPPQLPGLEALWGGSAFHCPFCHGWEVRDQPLAVLADGERAVHMALMLKGWTDDVVVLSNGAGLENDLLAAAGIAVDDRQVSEFHAEGGVLTEVRFTEGAPLPRRGVLVAAVLHQRSHLAAHLGVAFAPASPVAADAIVVDQFQRTTVPECSRPVTSACRCPRWRPRWPVGRSRRPPWCRACWPMTSACPSRRGRHPMSSSTGTSTTGSAIGCGAGG